MYSFKTISASTASIYSGREKVGYARKVPEGWTVNLRGHVVTMPTSEQAFKEAVRKCNRIAICGEDDEAKARAALAERNAEVRRSIEEFNELGGGFFRARARRSSVLI